jgi:HEPN domain-containing protein
MVDAKIVIEWLQKADEDLNFARSTLQQEGNDFYAQICFHFHQAAEKYLKSYIVAYDLEFEKTHNLIRLLSICSSQISTVLSLMKECERLNTSYIDTRYPVHWPIDYTKEKALKLKDDAEKIAKTITGLLEKGGYV